MAGNEERLHVFPENPPDPGAAALLPPFSRWHFSMKPLPEIAAHSEQTVLQIAPLLSRGGSTVTEQRPLCPFHPPKCLGTDPASPGAPLPPGKWGCAGIPGFAAGAGGLLTQPRASYSPTEKDGLWLPGQVTRGTQHVGPLPQWPGITTPSCCAALWAFLYPYCAIVKLGNTIFSVGLTDLLIVCNVSNSSFLNLIFRIYGANILALY